MSDNRADIEKCKRALEHLDHNIRSIQSWRHLCQPVDIIGFEVGNLAKCQIDCSLAGITARELADTLLGLLFERRRQTLAGKAFLESTGTQLKDLPSVSPPDPVPAPALPTIISEKLFNSCLHEGELRWSLGSDGVAVMQQHFEGGWRDVPLVSARQPEPEPVL